MKKNGIAAEKYYELLEWKDSNLEEFHKLYPGRSLNDLKLHELVELKIYIDNNAPTVTTFNGLHMSISAKFRNMYFDTLRKEEGEEVGELIMKTREEHFQWLWNIPMNQLNTPITY